MSESNKTNDKDKGDIYLLNLMSKEDLYAAYMPFIKNGGLFIRTDKQHQLGDEVFIVYKMPEMAEKISVVGRIAWITPPCAQGGRDAGVGVQFTGDNADQIQKKIETYLAGSLQSERRTDTL